MERNENKTNYSIKSKLVSAIAMLLVATVMVVSSTYAWFTLSTAPEVSGVSTAVGANGALEMLLATKDDNGWIYNSGTVNGKTPVERNTFWGNMVDLSDASYGSGNITLYPSKLNLNGSDLNLNEPLQTPSFGPDGRVEALTPGGQFAKFNGTSFVSGANDFGFRGLGVASGLTERQQAFRSAISAMATAQYNAQNEARRSLSANGTPLAKIAILRAMQGTTAKVFTADDIAVINSMITGLETSLKQVEEAYVQAIIAYALGNAMNHATDLEANTFAGSVRNAANISNAALNDRLTAVFGLLAADATTVKTSLLGYDTYEAAVEAVATAREALENVPETTEYAWTDISASLSPLVGVDVITINGVPAGEVTQDDNKSKIAGDILGGKGVQVSIPTGGGVYADVADLCGDYTVEIEIMSDDLNVGVDGLTIKATMTADSTEVKPFLTVVNETLNLPANQPSGDNAGALPLTELYGYVIDLAFRTNAAQSNLLLQTDAIDRIYNTNDNDETMGSGSTMTFKSNSSDFTTAQVRALMSNIRVVFYNTAGASGFAEIYANAKLDLVNDVVEDANGVTAKLFIYKTATKYTYNNGTADVEVYKLDNKYYTSATCETEATIPEGATLTATTTTVEVQDDVITSLNQNEIKHISALVYLDGENIENDDVAATVAASMSGSVNFQFASSAALVPMEYGDLHTVQNN